MVAWIIYFKDAAKYNRTYIDFYRKEGEKLGIHVKLILVEDLTFGVDNGQLFLNEKGHRIEQKDYPEFVLFRAIYPLLNRHLERMGMKVFNNSFVSEICNDKAKTYQYLADTGIPMLDSIFCLNQDLESQLGKITQATVVKTVDGHGGKQVFLFDPVDGKDGESQPIPEEVQLGIGSSDVVLQPLTGTRRQDLRVYVIGKEIIAAVLRTAKQGFLSNYSLGGDVCLYTLSKEEIQTVHRIIEKFDFGLVGIDFLIGDQGELIFNEIEDVVGSRMLYQCSKVNIVERYLNFICQKISADSK